MPKPTAVAHAPRPLWLSTVGYFFISSTAALLLFAIVWSLLHDEDEHQTDTPLIIAGIAAFLLMGLAVIVREVVQRRASNSRLLRQARLNQNFANANAKSKVKKFSLEQNTAALRLIQKKSEAANNSLDAGEKHLEAFRLCQEYLNLVEKELQTVNVGSPRLPALRNGQERVQIMHKQHLLNWAAETARSATREAAVRVELNDKIEAAQRALETLNSALLIYPNEPQLIESTAAVREFTTSIRVSHWIEAAERAAFKGYFQNALDHYADALFYLSRETVDPLESAAMTERLKSEIQRMQTALEQNRVTEKNLNE